MLAAIPTHEMAETLRILAGTNAGNAARHFGRQSYESGDIASAVLWSSIVQALEGAVAVAQESAEKPEAQPVPRHMMSQLEAAAFQDVRFEDVDSDVLIREVLQETLEAIGDAAGSPPKAATDFAHAEYGAAHAALATPERKLELVSARAPQPEAGDTPSRRASRPIWSRVVKPNSRRMAA
jgi:hypothetical protein